MLLTIMRSVVLAGLTLLAAKAAPGPAPDRVVLLEAGDDAYRALAIPRSYKTQVDASTRLLVFRGGLCIRDIGLADVATSGQSATPTTAFVEQSGTMEHGYVAPDGRVGAIVRTRYVSRVDVTPGETSTANDTVTGDTTLTLIDPAHPEGRWQVTLEESRWVKDVLVLPRGKGLMVTTFLPRNGPSDVRLLDPAGREWLRIPDTAGATLRIEASPDGTHAAAEVVFPDRAEGDERGVIVFDLATGTQWTYGWRYGSDAEPLSWKLEDDGVLGVKLVTGTKQFTKKSRKR